MAGESLRQQPLHWWLSQWGQSHGPADLCKMHRRICYGCYAMPQIVWRRFCRIITTAVQQISKDAKFLIGSSIVKKSQIYLHTSHVGKAGGFSQYLCPVYASVCLSVCLSVCTKTENSWSEIKIGENMCYDETRSDQVSVTFDLDLLTLTAVCIHPVCLPSILALTVKYAHFYLT